MRPLTSVFAALWSAGLGITAVVGVSGCRAEPSDEPPVLLERNMYDQEKVKAQGYNEYPFFSDHRNMRQPPEGTMARDYYDDNHLDDDEFVTGLDDHGRYVLVVPPAAFQEFGGPEATLKRGQQRFDIFCSPCHSKIGDGKGAVAMVMADDGTTLVARPGGFPTIPDFVNDPATPTKRNERILHMPDGQVFNTISHGVRNMPAYANQIPIADRWAIVGYLRALQKNQMVARLPENTSPPPARGQN